MSRTTSGTSSFHGIAALAVAGLFVLVPVVGLAGVLSDPGGIAPAAVGGRLALGPIATASPSAASGSWAVGVHAINATPNPSEVQGVQMTASLPAVPSGMTSTAGPYYMLVLSVIFPNGRFAQIDVRASPPGTDGCFLIACYQSVYDIAKFPGGVSASSLESEPGPGTYRLAIWRDAGAGKWRYGIAVNGGGGWSIERNDFLSSLNPNFADADSSTFVRVDQPDVWFGVGSFLQEFAALESYDWSASDWSRIGVVNFGPAMSFLQGTGSSVWPDFTASRGAIACSTGTTCLDPDGRAYMGFIGCCNGIPTFASIAGVFQGSASMNAFNAGDSGSQGAGPGDVLWADLPSVSGLAFVPDAIRGGNTTRLTWAVLNPNGFSLRLGFRRLIRSTTTGLALPDAAPDVGPLTISPGRTNEPEALATSLTTAQDFYDALVEVWSGTPGASASAVLGSSGWTLRALVVDNDPPTAAVAFQGTRGRGTWYVSTVSVNISGTDSLSGVASGWYRLDGTNASSFVRYVAPLTVSGDGAHVLEYFVVDRAGNAGTRESVAFAIDATPPSLTIQSPADGTGFPNGTFRVTWAGQDADSGIEHYSVQLGDAPLVNVSGSLSHGFAGIPNGTYSIRVLAEDWAGNEATQAITVHIGAAPPNVGLWVTSGAILAALVAGALVWAVARRRRTPREGLPPNEEPVSVEEPKRP